MRNIFIAMILVLGTTLQAQTFDFSCEPITYSNSFNLNGVKIDSTYVKGSTSSLDFFASGYSGSATVNVNAVMTLVSYESGGYIYFDTDGNKVDSEPEYGHELHFFSNMKWRWKTINVSQDNTITVLKVDTIGDNGYPVGYSVETFGNLYDFMPTTSANAVLIVDDNDVIPAAGTYWQQIISSTGGNFHQDYTTFSQSTVAHNLGGSTIHKKRRTITWLGNGFVASTNSKFNDLRIVDGEYDGYVMMANGNKVDIIAKWTISGVVDYAVIFHKTWDWRKSHKNSIRLDLDDINGGTNFNN